MSSLTYSIDINAPAQTVWDTMLSPGTFQQWTTAFHEGSYYEGGWDEGSQIRFLAEDDGQLGGMLALVIKNTTHEQILLEYLGQVINSEDDTTSDDAQQWVGAYESYDFEEHDGVTTLTVEMDGANISPPMIDMFADMWPLALEKLKELAEEVA